MHDGFHAAWPEELLPDVMDDPQEQNDLADLNARATEEPRRLLEEWTAAQIKRWRALVDPMEVVLAERGLSMPAAHCPNTCEAREDRSLSVGEAANRSAPSRLVSLPRTGGSSIRWPEWSREL